MDVVRIDEKNRSRIDSEETPEGFDFTFECENVAVRHCAGDGYSPQMAGQYARCRIHAADIKSSRLFDTGVGAVHPPHPEIDDGPPLRRTHDAGRLRSGQRGELN